VADIYFATRWLQNMVTTAYNQLFAGQFLYEYFTLFKSWMLYMSIFRLTSAKTNVVCFGNWSLDYESNKKYDVDLGSRRMRSSHLERQCFIKINAASNIIKFTA